MGLLTGSLPPPAGPYAVSTTDLELPASSPSSSFSHARLRSTGQPALQLDTVLVTLYYPAYPHRPGSGQKQHWLQRPVAQTAAGYARFAGKNPWLVKTFLRLFGARIRLPVEGDAALAFKDVDGQAAGGDEMKERQSMDTLVGEETAKGDNTFPLVIFSHGLSGTRTTYSQWCTQIASHGYIVAAIEHRDGSGPISVVRLEKGEERVVDYIRAEEHLEYPDGHSPLTSLQFRSPQLLMRLAEIRETLALLSRINDGDGAAVAAENRRKDYGGEGVVGKWLPAWKGRVGMDEMVMAGHSFGGATTIQALRASSPSYPFVRGIALDPWADPIPPAPSSPAFSSPTKTSTRASDPAPTASPGDGEEGGEGGEGEKVPLDVKVPLLVINSEAFTLWRVHYGLVRGIVEAVEGGRGWLMTLIGSIHTSFSDLPLLSPYLARRSGARVNPASGLTTIVEACREFLAREGADGEILGREVVPGDEEGGRPGEGKDEQTGEKRVMEGEVGGVRMHVRGRE
ncbi:hypothetical protein JCM6882_000890 [Rhodosporidiobolus microsporus]